MARPITLFTGQWADLPLAERAPLARKMGCDGLELACWGDHFDVQQALASPSYVRDGRALLAEHGLQGRMDRVHGAPESAAFCRRLDLPPAKGAFDAVFDKAGQGGMAGSAP